VVSKYSMAEAVCAHINYQDVYARLPLPPKADVAHRATTSHTFRIGSHIRRALLQTIRMLSINAPTRHFWFNSTLLSKDI